jgi:cytoskeletal protein RodZ
MKEDVGVLGLATIRKNRGISLAQIADSTKISVRSLEAIEHGDFHKLPGGIYSTSYIRQYARAIDYDESTILSYYHQTMGGAEKVNPGAGNGSGFVGGYGPPSTILGS